MIQIICKRPALISVTTLEYVQLCLRQTADHPNWRQWARWDLTLESGISYPDGVGYPDSFSTIIYWFSIISGVSDGTVPVFADWSADVVELVLGLSRQMRMLNESFICTCLLMIWWYFRINCNIPSSTWASSKQILRAMHDKFRLRLILPGTILIPYWPVWF